MSRGWCLSEVLMFFSCFCLILANSVSKSHVFLLLFANQRNRRMTEMWDYPVFSDFFSPSALLSCLKKKGEAKEEQWRQKEDREETKCEKKCFYGPTWLYIEPKLLHDLSNRRNTTVLGVCYKPIPRRTLYISLLRPNTSHRLIWILDVPAVDSLSGDV